MSESTASCSVLACCAPGLDEDRERFIELSARGREIAHELVCVFAGDPHSLAAKIAIANAQVAYQAFRQYFASPRWERLAAKNAAPQRPLWASTSTKDPRFPDVYYVEALIAPSTVNTLPPDTFAAYLDHGNPKVRIDEGDPQELLRRLTATGIDLADVTAFLEEDGVTKFAASYNQLLTGIASKIEILAGT